jgi:hypothetical protein
LKRLFQDPDQGVQREAAYWLHYYFFEDAKAAGVYQMFPDLKYRESARTVRN